MPPTMNCNAAAPGFLPLRLRLLRVLLLLVFVLLQQLLLLLLLLFLLHEHLLLLLLLLLPQLLQAPLSPHDKSVKARQLPYTLSVLYKF